jgi:glutamate mutase epsilon subunit
LAKINQDLFGTASMTGPVVPPGKSESFALSEGDLVQMQRRKWTNKGISELGEGAAKIIRWIRELLQGGK